MRRLLSTIRRRREVSRRVAVRAGGAALIASCLASLAITTSAAQAVLIDMNAVGQGSNVAFNPADQTGYYGVAMVPGTDGSLLGAGIPTVTDSATCTDPALSPDLSLPGIGLCSHGGSVMHANETFALTWDPDRLYWSTTRNYVEQYLSDVATASGSLGSPFADTSQYTDASGRAANSSLYGGACIDYGSAGGFTCKFGDTNGSGTGNDYPTSGGCPVTGYNQWYEYPGGAYGPNGGATNEVCLTDAQIRAELTSMIPQTGILSHTKPGYTPLVVLLTPPGVVTCLDTAGTLCSDNGAANSGGPSALFCSYHGEVNVGGTEVPYVVQPWTASWTEPSGCDDPSIASIPNSPPPANVFATDVGQRLVSPLSQSEMAAITNPYLNGWFNNATGDEINDNDGCVPAGNNLDQVTVAANQYYLQREFNNAGVIESDPNALICTPTVWLIPSFVAPSAVNQGDEVVFDGSASASTLIVPKANYAWNFGDGTTAVGPSVTHTYSTPGTYTVTLTLTDRGGNTATQTQSVTVLGPSGQSSAPPTTQPTSGAQPSTAMQVHLQLVPQSLKQVLSGGIVLEVKSNRVADGIVTVSISRSEAKRAHIKAGRGPSVVIARGTTAGITDGGSLLWLHLPKATAKKLKKLGRASFTIRLSLVAAGGAHVAVDVAGRY